MSAPREEIKLEIILRTNGRIDVNGPLQNKVLCFGLLTAAQHAIEDFNKRQERSGEKPAIEIPRLRIPGEGMGPELRGGNG